MAAPASAANRFSLIGGAEYAYPRMADPRTTIDNGGDEANGRNVTARASDVYIMTRASSGVRRPVTRGRCGLLMASSGMSCSWLRPTMKTLVSRAGGRDVASVRKADWGDVVVSKGERAVNERIAIIVP